MDDRKPHNYKVSCGNCWEGWKGVGEILVHVALALCVVYALYSFFHEDGSKKYTAEKEKAETQDQELAGYRIEFENLKP